MQPPCIFISYSSKDRASAEELHESLTHAGFRVWRDKTRLDTDWPREIAEGLANEADAVCLLWSRNAAQSRWVKHEWLTARALEKRIFPCTLGEAPDLPLPLSPLDAIPFGAVSDLLKRIQSTSDFRHRYQYTILPEKAFIPFNPNPEFCGRERDLLELYMKLAGNLKNIGINQAGITGMGGSGKTQLAIEFAYRFSFAFDEIFWVQAAEVERWLPQIVQIARDRIGLKIEDPTGPGAWQRYVLALQTYCKKHPATLFIFDNVPDSAALNAENTLEGLAPLALGANLLFTSRHRFALPGVLEHSLDVLPPLGAYSLLTSARPPSGPDEERSARDICEAVGRLPLALVLISAFLSHPNNRARIVYADYLIHLHQDGLAAVDLDRVSSEELATRHTTSIAATLRQEWQLVTREDARRCFRLLGLFPEGAIVPKTCLGLLAGIEQTHDLLDALAESLGELYQLHLLEVAESDASVRVPPLVREFALSLIPDEERGAMRAQAASSLASNVCQPTRLERLVRKHGVDAVAGSLEIAIKWTPANASLKMLSRMIDNERSFLGQEASVLQQLHHRAFSMGLHELAGEFAQAARQHGPVLRSLVLSAAQDPAWIRSLRGHSSGVRRFALTPDGWRALSVSGEMILWDAPSGRAIRSFKTDWSVNCVSISSDGRRGLSSGYGEVILWDLESGAQLWRQDRPKEDVRAVCFSPDDRLALIGSEKRHFFWNRGSLELVDAASGKRIRSLRGHSQKVECACFSRDGLYALSGGWDSCVLLWDVRSGKCLQRLTHPDWINSVALSPDGDLALASSRDGAVILWDLKSGSRVRELLVFGMARSMLNQPSWVLSVAFNADGTRALGGSENGNLILWDVSSGYPLREFRGHSGMVKSVCFTPDGSHALSASSDGTMIYWDISVSGSPWSIVGSAERFEVVCLTRDGQSALVGTRDGGIDLWNTSTGERIRRLGSCPKGDPVSICVSADSNRALSGTQHGEIVLWDVPSGARLNVFEHHSEQFYGVSLNQDGTRAITGSWDGTVAYWDLTEPTPLWTRKQGGRVMSLSLTLDSGRALSGSWVSSAEPTASRLVLWDVESGRPARNFDTDEFQITSCLSPDGRHALSAGWSGKLVLWDTETGQAIRSFDTGSVIVSICFGPDGRRAISASEDNALTLWDVSSGAIITRLYLQNCSKSLDWQSSTIACLDRAGVLHFFRFEEGEPPQQP
jgi:WD40 repeat protein